ncbi:TIGR03571 family LLM class oxidoreductase [Streptomyces phaeoluteigriseus]|uniref:TIGR03571 family LLM class oxidoreductase n=1 Tax=Streptomyces phaeoluteigriseus TaxID=114686 RepID=A0ABY4Z6L8_9ACTN|nr:TIGR03571 family LLM class oxidoreductase [Streptomyces phaeoluteigriseus]USQ83967.1 TIGR03571 family LLM class oxidoreductase [Streptomyces phaeoluteigriseus]
MSTALQRLLHPAGTLTLGLELPLDNDWGPARLRRDQAVGRPFGVPDLSSHAERAALADRLGFAALWVRDVPLYDPVRFGDAGTVFETFTHLGHLAAVTERAVLGTAAVVLPLRKPLLVAKAAATVDQLSGRRRGPAGRFVLGVAGGDRPVEYPLFGEDFDRRTLTFRENLSVVRQAWRIPPTGRGITATGLGLEAERQLAVLPKPFNGSIPVVVAGRAGQNLDWLAAHVDGWFNYPRDPKAAAGHVASWRAATESAQLPARPYLTPMLLDLTENPDTPPSPIRLGLRTGRHALVDHLRAMSDLGVAHLSLSLRPGDRPVEEVMRELAEEVLPHFPTPDTAPAPASAPAPH